MNQNYRTESSVSLGIDEYGETVFMGDKPGPVIHRTPEELGIPRVILAEKPVARPPDPEQRRKAIAEPRKRESLPPAPLPCVQLIRCEEGERVNELKEKVLAAPDTPVNVLMERTGASKAQIYNWRYEARKKAGKVAAPKQPRPAKASPNSLQSVTIDPQRPGTASALIDALARRDAASAVTVRLEFTESEVAALIGKLSEAQRAAFLAAGVKAAILG